MEKNKDIVFTQDNIDKLDLITLPEGINIYHGSQTKTTFDPNDIKLSDGTLFALFSNNPKLSADHFMNCAEFPVTNGYLHQFSTIKEIPNIKVITSYNFDKDMKILDKIYCQKPENPKLNGFCYPVINNEILHNNKPSYDYIIGLCNPNEYIKYVSTSICLNPYRLTNPSNIFHTK